MKKYLPYGLSGLITLLVMIPLYRRGFVFLLDMVWPPMINLADYVRYGYPASLPIIAMVKGLNLLFPLDVVQKIVLSLLLFLSGATMYQLVQKTARPLFSKEGQGEVSDKNPSLFLPFVRGGQAWATTAGVLYMLNPWVYERFLAGHWFVLLGYALFPLMVKLFWQMIQKKRRRDIVAFALAFALYPMASLHWAYIAGVVFGVTLIGFVIARQVGAAKQSSNFQSKREDAETTEDRHTSLPLVRDDIKNVLKIFGFIASCWLVLNSFWLFSGFLGGEQAFSKISFDDFKAFATLSDPTVGVFGNVLSLYGFWQTAIILPKDLSQNWWVYPLIVLGLSAVGARCLWREREALGKAVSIAFIPVVLVSVGYAHGFTRPIVEFLYHALPGFKGLRETEKLVGLIAFTYALLAPFGMKWIVERIGSLFSNKLQRIIAVVGLCIAFLIPFATTGTMLWGFQGRVAPAEYPPSWHEARRLISADPNANNILVFPWHGYMSLSLAQYRVVLNPAPSFFGHDRVIAGKNIENAYLKETDQGIWDEKVFRMIHGFETLDDNIEFLRASGVTHIVLLKEADWREQYGFVQSSRIIEPKFDANEITVYKLK